MKDINNSFDDGRFACPWTTGYNQNFFIETLFYGALLHRGKFKGQLFLHVRDGAVYVKIGSETWKRRQFVNRADNFLLGFVEKRKVNVRL